MKFYMLPLQYLNFVVLHLLIIKVDCTWAPILEHCWGGYYLSYLILYCLI